MTKRTDKKYALMGIINITDNSFVSGSRLLGVSTDQLLARVQMMVDNGAGYIDVGACSSAPGNSFISEEEEWKRLKEPLRAMLEAFPTVKFSVDSFRSGIIENCLKLGHKIIVNDIFAGIADPRILDVTRANNLSYIAMDQSSDPYTFFLQWADKAADMGIEDWILDPGFGFGKTVEQNWAIMDKLERFQDFGRPVLSATSRKRMIWIPLGLKPESCAEQSVDAEILAVEKGAAIIRTHDTDIHRSRRCNSGI